MTNHSHVRTAGFCGLFLDRLVWSRVLDVSSPSSTGRPEKDLSVRAASLEQNLENQP